MTPIQQLFDDATALVKAATRVLKNEALGKLIAKVAKLGNIGAEINAILDTLVECFRAIAKGLEALVEPLRQVAAMLALVELFAPMAGALGEALAAFGEQLAAFGAPVPPGNGFSKTMGDIKGTLDKLGDWVGKVVPSPDDLAALARAFGSELVGALDGLRQPALGGA